MYKRQLVALAEMVRQKPGVRTDAVDDLAMESLFATLTNVDFDDAEIKRLTECVHAEKSRVAETSGVVNAPDFLMRNLWDAQEDIRCLKSLILLGLRGVAAYAYHAAVLEYRDEAVSGSYTHLDVYNRQLFACCAMTSPSLSALTT